MQRKIRVKMDSTEYDITSKYRRKVYSGANSRFAVKAAKRRLSKKARRSELKVQAEDEAEKFNAELLEWQDWDGFGA